MSSPAAAATTDKLVLSERHGPVLVLTLNRPKALNALSSPLFGELNKEFDSAQRDEGVRAVVLTGGEKVFAGNSYSPPSPLAGADIKEMKDKTLAESYKENYLASWAKITDFTKPVIGAVNGYALGGGCELAMMCDILIASPTATFGQPEITLGILPGAGGTQRLTHLVGKARAMDIVLTGRKIKAEEAERIGLVSRLVQGDGKECVAEAVKVATLIAGYGGIAVQAAKEAVNAANNLPLNEGLRLERRLFHAMFGTADQKEGMAAFAEKRKPNFSHL
ncbi:hypothetical protein QFC22_000169 [Naganishia vaughanmartiniae]|uniref:Uncharacterized protein n=1 Tax=Naganishia vaughanmartiniae TaxID=1424756 RepID=A0ACC2XMC0_9TREE|nr:hypothetical protein QFC22_000169 [Naganishia vaughanmartiniae]